MMPPGSSSRRVGARPLLCGEALARTLLRRARRSPWKELPDGAGALAAVHKIAQRLSHGSGQLLHEVDRGTNLKTAFCEQAVDVGGGLELRDGWFADAESWPQPTPESHGDEQLPAPAQQAVPSRGISGPAESNADDTSAFADDAVPVESFDDHRGGIPAPRMEPVGQEADGVPADTTQEAPNPDDEPTRLGQAADLPAIHAVTDQLQNTLGIAGRLAAAYAGLGAEPRDGWSVRAARAELLDGNGKAVYNDHRSVGGGAESRSLRKEGPRHRLPSSDGRSSYSSSPEVSKHIAARRRVRRRVRSPCGGGGGAIRQEFEARCRSVSLDEDEAGTLHAPARKRGVTPGIQYPRVPGHEVAGTIDELGAGVSEWQ